jgi:competence protein ComEC
MGLTLRQRAKGWSIQRLLVCWLAVVLLWCAGLASRRLADSRWLMLDVLDVGHGDSSVIQTPSGRTILVDAGSEEAGRYRVVPYLRWAGVQALDAVVITHWDADHAGGAIPVLERLRVRRLLTNGARDDTMTFRRIEALARRSAVSWDVLSDGVVIDGGEGVSIECLHPPPGLVPEAAPDSNDHSVVLRLRKGTVSLLLTGDIEEAGLPWLLQRPGTLASTVLKVPHHGSALGEAGARFFRAVHPAVALISVGRLHRLPHPSTLAALQEVGAQTLVTVHDGAIRVRTDGQRLLVTTFRTRRRVP